MASNRSSPVSSSDPVKAQIRSFFGQKFDPRNALQNQKGKLAPGILDEIGSTEDEWLENWELIAANFDVFDWWEKNGRQLFPLIYPVACCILPLPDSNGHQERTFSAATWMDGKLRSMQSDITFQMKVILYKNKAFLEQHRRHVRDDQQAAAEERTRELLQYSASLKKESDIDEEMDMMLEAYAAEDEEEVRD